MLPHNDAEIKFVNVRETFWQLFESLNSLSLNQPGMLQATHSFLEQAN